MLDTRLNLQNIQQTAGVNPINNINANPTGINFDTSIFNLAGQNAAGMLQPGLNNQQASPLEMFAQLQTQLMGNNPQQASPDIIQVLMLLMQMMGLQQQQTAANGQLLGQDATGGFLTPQAAAGNTAATATPTTGTAANTTTGTTTNKAKTAEKTAATKQQNNNNYQPAAAATKTNNYTQPAQNYTQNNTTQNTLQSNNFNALGNTNLGLNEKFQAADQLVRTYLSDNGEQAGIQRLDKYGVHLSNNLSNNTNAAFDGKDYLVNSNYAKRSSAVDIASSIIHEDHHGKDGDVQSSITEETNAFMRSERFRDWLSNKTGKNFGQFNESGKALADKLTPAIRQAYKPFNLPEKSKNNNELILAEKKLNVDKTDKTTKIENPQKTSKPAETNQTVKTDKQTETANKTNQTVKTEKQAETTNKTNKEKEKKAEETNKTSA